MADPGLIVVGAGGFGRETIELVRALQKAGDPVELRGVCDDDPAWHGGEVLGVPVLGASEAVADYPDCQVVVTIGNPSNFGVRRRIVEAMGLASERFATLVHPTAVVPGSADIGVGSIVHAGCVLTADIVVGAHVVMMPAVVLTHDDRVGDFATIGAGALVAGGVTIGEGAYVGSGARIREYCTVGAGSLVGMGAVVVADIPSGEIWAGTPAEFMGKV